MFTLTVFEMLLSEGRLVLSPTQQGTGSEWFKKKIILNGLYAKRIFIFECEIELFPPADKTESLFIGTVFKSNPQNNY